ncbi:MAG TPA: HAD family phosphatase, partial [Vicinamibacterales bacterium]
MAIAAIIFDFDGVLADTERLHLAATQDALATLGLEMSEAEYFKTYLGYSDRDLFRRFAHDAKRDLTDDDIDDLIEAKGGAYERALTTGAVLYDGAERAIFALKFEFTLAIASGAFRSEIESILAARPGLRDSFAAIVSADDHVAGKPSPEPYLEALRQLEIDADQAIAVEDSPWGLDAARGAGLRTIAVTTSYDA